MSRENIKVSIAVVTYNQEGIIGRCLDSLVSQITKHNYEIVIGEDCSTDNTRQICAEYAVKYPNTIKLLPATANLGVIRNFRNVIATCEGEYIMQCAGDDWWHSSNKLQVETDFLDKNPHIGMVHSDVNLYNAAQDTTIIGLNNSQNRLIPTDSNYAPYLLTEILPIYTPTPCYRRSLMEKVDLNMFLDRGWVMEDLPMWLEMSRYSSFGYINQSLATYTASPVSACRPDTLNKHLNFESNVTSVQQFYRENYFQDIVSEEDINQADIKRKITVYRRFKMNREAFQCYQMLNFNDSKIRSISQKNYYLYLLLIFGRTIINRIMSVR